LTGNPSRAAVLAAMTVAIGGALARPAPAQVVETAEQACRRAGDNCVANIHDEAACRASQAACIAAMSQRDQSDTGNSPTDRVSPDTPSPADMPPYSPVAEAPDDHGDQTTPAECAASARDLVETRLHGRIDRVLITVTSRWGTVWRADFTTTSGGQAQHFRFVCTQSAIAVSPMQMADPTGNIAPLPAS
jgi:hypothetical protein